MSKEAAVCPFSRRMCKECADLLGQAFRALLVSQLSTEGKQERQRQRLGADEVFTKWEMPEIPDGANIMVDIEDFIERRGI